MMRLDPDLREMYGRNAAKIGLEAIEALDDRPRAKYVFRHCYQAHTARRGQDDDSCRIGPGL